MVKSQDAKKFGNRHFAFTFHLLFPGSPATYDLAPPGSGGGSELAESDEPSTVGVGGLKNPLRAGFLSSDESAASSRQGREQPPGIK